ncbi:hypothetical protein TwortDSMZ_169 [Staphylococcus phage Twort]|uniref:ORF088 n=2 Tax=Staphylococcus phage Twort (strain DSM 17442 / HER 48) TaxID=2908167 RepID=Q4Z976_BPTWO|nr:DNA binding protein [Staphylococcus phage Twort]AAX92382.1 ORF088 [Staphylococcus phage Twort]QIW89167.1 hypothetical protein TwortDSMZ_169 [Staphylococcus phage Twort]
MIIYLNNEEKNLVKENKYTPLESKFKTKKEKDIVEMYRKGHPVNDICNVHNISMGMLYTVVNNHKLGKRNVTKGLLSKIKHILNNKNKLENLINDYGKLTNKEIYSKYQIHKNGLYYILDLYNIERKQDTKDEVLSDNIVIEE